jgi:hypothetical protein
LVPSAKLEGFLSTLNICILMREMVKIIVFFHRGCTACYISEIDYHLSPSRNNRLWRGASQDTGNKEICPYNSRSH